RRPVQYIEVESHHGHDAFLMADPPYTAAVAAYMDNVYKELQP
ncbi:TPA: homoserine O-acetyltransferase, partial [Neisseria bacilliformis]